eukprot:TRINITY_DN574_c0_g1_i1.p1 TRINITY_DN574_c0_g1~~TRINITY_DN574_c0_g1_i1.p1  ORF type:complete len:496 (+),score=149.68 TRINITY_DN574_c0_g1_i1:265-1752(+)
MVKAKTKSTMVKAKTTSPVNASPRTSEKQTNDAKTKKKQLESALGVQSTPKKGVQSTAKKLKGGSKSIHTKRPATPPSVSESESEYEEEKNVTNNFEGLVSEDSDEAEEENPSKTDATLPVKDFPKAQENDSEDLDSGDHDSHSEQDQNENITLDVKSTNISAVKSDGVMENSSDNSDEEKFISNNSMKEVSSDNEEASERDDDMQVKEAENKAYVKKKQQNEKKQKRKKENIKTDMQDAEAPMPKKKRASKNNDQASTPKPPEGAKSSGRKKVFVGNLPFKFAEDAFKQFFDDLDGIVEYVLPKKRDGRSHGYGFVVFNSEEAAAKAMEKHGQDFGGRTLRLDLCSDSKKQDQKPSNMEGQDSKSTTMFVKGFGKTKDDDEISNFVKDQYGNCGEIVDIRIPKDFETGRSKGFCYVVFKNRDSLLKALDLRVDGIYVDEESKKGGQRNSGGRGGNKGRGRRNDRGWGNGNKGRSDHKGKKADRSGKKKTSASTD